MLNNEANKNLTAAPDCGEQEIPNEEAVAAEETDKGNWLNAFRIALDKARRQKPVDNRKELSRDKSKSLFLLLGVGVALLLLFLGVFSSPKKRTRLSGENPRGQASLGRKVTPGQETSDPTKAVTPMLSADVRSTDPAPGGQITPEDIGRTSRTGAAPVLPPASTPAAKTKYPQDYALSKVDFSDPASARGNTIAAPPTAPALDPVPDLKKPSLVFVRAAAATKPAIKPQSPGDDEEMLSLPVGTRLVARLETPVSSAVPAPVVAVVEYNYERSGQIVLPAGAKIFGRLAQVNPSGYVGMQFNQVEMPDGTAQKIDASAMDLNFGPLKGYVSGKKKGTRFLVRSLTGLGTMASYLVGGQGSGSTGLISTNTLMRERLADNIATAGQEELNGMAFSQNLVVTVPGNTRFYIVIQKQSSERGGAAPLTRSSGSNSAGLRTERLPTLEELRQLIQLKREISDLYTQTSSQTSSQSPQQ